MIFDPRPVSHPLGGLGGWGQKVKVQLFQNRVMLHGAYHIKENQECSNIVANMLLIDAPLPGDGAQ